MKKMIIKPEMLGTKDILFFLTKPLPDKVYARLSTEMEKNKQARHALDLFLSSLSLVRTMLKCDRVDKLTSVKVCEAIEICPQLPDSCRRLLGPSIDSLMAISARLDLFADIKHYIDSAVSGYLSNRDNAGHLLEDTVWVIDKMDMALETLSIEDFQAVSSIFSDTLTKVTAPLYATHRPGHSAKKNEFDPFAKEAFDIILYDGTRRWPFVNANDIEKLLRKADALGYEASEIWALKVLSIRKVCLLIHEQSIAGMTVDFRERIDLLMFGYELGKDALSPDAQTGNYDLSHVAVQIQHLLGRAKNDMFHACKDDPCAMDYFNTRLSKYLDVSED